MAAQTTAAMAAIRYPFSTFLKSVPALFDINFIARWCSKTNKNNTKKVMQIRITDNSWSSQSAFSYPMIPIAVIVITNIKNTFNTRFPMMRSCITVSSPVFFLWMTCALWLFSPWSCSRNPRMLLQSFVPVDDVPRPDWSVHRYRSHPLFLIL